MMASDQIDAMDRELHPQAEKLAKQYIKDFSISLLLQAKLIAYRAKADIVLRNHIDEAIETINKNKRQSWSHELSIILGGAFLGAFIQGFLAELSSGNAILIAIYTLIGFIGMFMVFWGLRR
jgi:hypothetical protein